MLPAAGEAAVIAWENTGTQFSTGGNWVGGTAPANNLTSDIAAFTAATPVATFNPTHTASRSIRGLQFDSGTAAWTMTATGGPTRTLTIGASGIVSNAQTVQTFTGSKFALRLGANQSFTSNSTGALYFDASLASFNLNSFTLTLNGTSTNLSNEIAASISGTGTLIKSGTGFWYLSGNSTFAGTTSITGGILAINSETSLGANPGTFTADQLLIDGGTLQTRGSNVVIDDTQRGVTIGASGGTIETITDLTIASPNVVAGTGILTKTGAGTLTLNAANTHTGNILVNAGTLATSGGASVGDAATVTVAAGATWQTNSSETVGLISGAGNIVFGSSNTLTVGTAANSTFAGVISDGAPTGALTKVGTGTLTLAGASTFTGLTTVSAGTLAYGTNDALGTGGVTVDGASSVLALGTFSDSVGTVTLANGGSITGTGTLSSTGSFELQSGSVSAVLGGTGTNLNKTTAGTVTLSGANTYTGATNIGTAGGPAGGTLVLGANHVLPDTTVNIFAGTLDVNSRTDTIGALNLGGGASGTTAAVTLTSGALTLGGNVTYNATNNPNGALISASAGGSLALGGNRSFNIGDSTAAPSDLTISAALTGAGFGLDKQGAGTMTLTGTNTYTGVTTLSGGTLSVATIGAGGVAGNLGQASNAAGNLVFNGGTLQYTGATASTDRGFTLNALTSSTIEVTNAATNLTLTGANTATSGALTKAGAGTLTLTGTNQHSGLTTVAAGTLVAGANGALGNSSGNILVNAGATLALAGGVNVTRTGTLTLNGNGTSASTGALHAAGGSGTTSQWTGSVTVDTPATITAANNLLIIGNGATGQFNTTTLTLNAGATFHTPSTPTVTPVYLPAPSYVLDPANIVIHSQITGSGGITKTGDGTLSIIRGTSVPNTFTGDTVITGGKLIVDGPSNQAHLSSTNIFVGNLGSTNDDTVVLQLGQATGSAPGNNLIGVYNAGTNASGSSLTLYEDGLFNMNRASNGFVNLTMHGGRVNGVSLNPLLTLTGSLFSRASAQTSIIENGNLGIGSSKLTMDVQAGTTPTGTDLLIGSRIQQGVGFLATPGAVALEKTGAGKAVLTGANTYGGITDVVAGVLNIQHASALGQNSVTLGSTDNGTIVRSGAQLQLQGGITVANETLTLNGDGGGTGALRNVGGNNRLDGIVYLNASSRINADAGTTLTLANPNGVNATVLDGTGNPKKDLTVGGAGDTVIAGGVAGFIGNVVKDGTGTLTLAGNNAYTGATSVTAGAVRVTHNNGLAGSGVTVSPNAALQFARDAASSDVTVVGVAATISGTGLANGGAIQNLDGNNTYLGAVTLAANSRITANAGSSLTLSGNVAGAGFTLEAGGAGSTTYSGAISGTGTTFTKTDGGTVTLAGTAANTFTGAAQVQDGTLVLAKTAGTNALGTTSVNIGDGVGSAASAVLRLGAAHQIADNAALVFAADGRLDLNNLSETVGSIAGTGNILIGTGQLVTGGTNASTTFGGTLTGTGLLAKEGSGTLTISSNLGYDGNIALNAGTLQFNANNTLGGSLTVQAGTTLRLVDTNLSLTNLTFAGTGNVTIDFAGSASILNVLGTLEIASGITITVRNWQDAADYWYAQNWLDAVYNLRGAAPMNRITFDNDGADPTFWTANQTVWQGYDRQITPVPEPSTYGALLLLTSGAFLAWRRRRQR